MGVECLRLLNEIIADFDEVSKTFGSVINLQFASFMSTSSCFFSVGGESGGKALLQYDLRNVIFKDDIVAMT